MANSSFANKKDLKFRITLAQTTFADGSNQVTFNNFRSTVDVSNAGWHTNGHATIKVWGLGQELMNSVTTLTWSPLSVNNKNLIECWAIDGTTETLVFKSDIVNAWGDYSSMPDVYLYIETSTCYNLMVQPADMFSSSDTLSLGLAFKNIADRMGVILEISKSASEMLIDRPYLQGSLVDQLRQLIDATGLYYVLSQDILSVYGPEETRQGQILVPLVNPETGLVGYPTFDNSGVVFKTLFNPAIRSGDAVKVESDIKRASGTFAVQVLDHHLSSNMPNGPWFSEIRCTNVNFVPRQ